MDKRQWISAISLSIAVFALWTVFETWYLKTHPPLPEQSNAAATQPAPVSNAPAIATSNPASTNPSTGPAATQGAAPAMAAGMHAVPSTQPAAEILLGSADKSDPTYAMQVALTADGAAVSDVVLNDYYSPHDNTQPKNAKSLYEFQKPFVDHPGTEVLATRSLIINDTPVDLWNVRWNTVSSTATSAVFSVDIEDQQGPVARVTKTYRLTLRTKGVAVKKSTWQRLVHWTKSFTSRQEDSNGPNGFEINVDQQVRNLRPTQTLKVRAILNGPTPAPAEINRPTIAWSSSGMTSPARTSNSPSIRTPSSRPPCKQGPDRRRRQAFSLGRSGEELILPQSSFPIPPRS